MDGLQRIGLTLLACGLNAMVSAQPVSGQSVAYPGQAYHDPTATVQACEPTFRGGDCNNYCLDMWRDYCLTRNCHSCGSPRRGIKIGCGLLARCRSGACGHDCGCVNGTIVGKPAPLPYGENSEELPPQDVVSPPASPPAEDDAFTSPHDTAPTGQNQNPVDASPPLPPTPGFDPIPPEVPAPKVSPVHPVPPLPPVPPVPPAQPLLPTDTPDDEQPIDIDDPEAEPALPRNVLPSAIEDDAVEAPLPSRSTRNDYIQVVSRRSKVGRGTSRLLNQLDQASRRR